MSNLNNEIEYQSFEQALNFVFTQQFKKLHTCLPGIIQSYDQSSKRAQILPAIERAFTNGNSQPLPILVDVPVVFPSGGGFTVTMPMKKGDAVLLIFSQRGITNFKKSFEQSLPDLDSLLSLKDAIAIAGFGALNITPSSLNGATMQSEDGNNAVIIEDDKVELKKGSNTLTVDDSQMQANISGATLTLNSSSLISSVPVFAPSYSGLNGTSANMVSGIDMNSQNIENAGAVTTTLGVDLSTHIHTGDSGGNTGTPKN